MDKRIKTLIADKKWSDDDIFKLLTAESSDADEEQSDNELENQSDSEDDEVDEVEEDATDEEQPDMRAMIKEILAEELHAMKGGKKAPKVKKTKKVKAPVTAINRVFGAL